MSLPAAKVGIVRTAELQELRHVSSEMDLRNAGRGESKFLWAFRRGKPKDDDWVDMEPDVAYIVEKGYLRYKCVHHDRGPGPATHAA